MPRDGDRRCRHLFDTPSGSPEHACLPSGIRRRRTTPPTPPPHPSTPSALGHRHAAIEDHRRLPAPVMPPLELLIVVSRTVALKPSPTSVFLPAPHPRNPDLHLALKETVIQAAYTAAAGRSSAPSIAPSASPALPLHRHESRRLHPRRHLLRSTVFRASIDARSALLPTASHPPTSLASCSTSPSIPRHLLTSGVREPSLSPLGDGAVRAGSCLIGSSSQQPPPVSTSILRPHQLPSVVDNSNGIAIPSATSSSTSTLSMRTKRMMVPLPLPHPTTTTSKMVHEAERYKSEYEEHEDGFAGTSCSWFSLPSLLGGF